MKFEIQQEDLQRALEVVASVVPNKTTLPILTAILFEVENEELRLSVTNLDISAVTTTDAAKVAREGKAAIPAQKLLGFVRNLAPGPVTLEEKDGRVKLRAGKASLEEASMNADEFPALPALAAKKALTMPVGVLTTMVNQTAYAVSRDETRPALMGILWEVRPEGLTLVATDAHRLALSTRSLDWSVDKPRDLIVATDALKQLPRLVGGLAVGKLDRSRGEKADSSSADQGALDADADDGLDAAAAAASPAEVEIFMGDNQLSFRVGPSVLHARLLEGPFPEYRAVLPQNNDKKLIVERELMQSAVRRVAITADRITSQIKMGVESGRMELQSRGTDGARAEDELDVSYDGEALEIGFNYAYLQDILKNMRTQQVQVSLRDPQSAAVFEPVDENGETSGELLCLLMPLRLATD
ncbi:MAG: DNA polymerase III subunit beta [Candidatus Krumholzibacteriia bacterium]